MFQHGLIIPFTKKPTEMQKNRSPHCNRLELNWINFRKKDLSLVTGMLMPGIFLIDPHIMRVSTITPFFVLIDHDSELSENIEISDMPL